MWSILKILKWILLRYSTIICKLNYKTLRQIRQIRQIRKVRKVRQLKTIDIN